MPAALEIALWKHLAKKYGREIDVTTMSSSTRDYCLVGD
ncbi:gp63 [Burkholderia pseudomallei 1710a]|uniref:Gp63 n=5 Tax=Burkholderia pseudomallei TaxID=28450 RepID=A0A0E1W110_BURPE|nr:gp63 [Burkholderia pseudomallei 1710a]